MCNPSSGPTITPPMISKTTAGTLTAASRPKTRGTTTATVATKRRLLNLTTVTTRRARTSLGLPLSGYGPSSLQPSDD